jgi:hypothetical protein
LVDKKANNINIVNTKKEFENPLKNLKKSNINELPVQIIEFVN